MQARESVLTALQTTREVLRSCHRLLDDAFHGCDAAVDNGKDATPEGYASVTSDVRTLSQRLANRLVELNGIIGFERSNEPAVRAR